MLTPEREALIRQWQKNRPDASRGDCTITKVADVYRDIDDLLAELDWTRVMLKDSLETGGLAALEELNNLRWENAELKERIVEAVANFSYP